MPSHVIVVGGGPAGISAALGAATAGAKVTLLEAGRQLGGQFWRHLPKEAPHDEQDAQGVMHHGWSRFLRMEEQVHESADITVCYETSVWAVSSLGTPGAPTSANETCVSDLAIETVAGPADGTDRTMVTYRANALVIATGAHDRTLPFPGWDLPGVYTGGATQAIAKSEGIALGDNVVVAGAGPFLLPVAASLTQAGARVHSVNEANRIRRLAAGWLPRPWELVGAPNKMAELVGYVSGHLRHRIPYHLGIAVIAAEGDGRVERAVLSDVDADWRPIPGTERRVDCDALCVTHGFTPRLEVAIAAGCELSDNRFVVIDEACGTSTPGVFAAGELTGVGGVDLALAEGSIAGHCAAGGLASDVEIRGVQRRRKIFSSFARRLEAAHGIRPGWRDWVTDDTIVCRCEEVTAVDLRRKACATSSASLRSQKLSTRAGLGVCQGRICGRSAEELLAQATGVESLDGGIIDRRPIHTPIRISELAGPVEETDPTTPTMKN
ncbi:pyridine nucleotide-disulfide oxidoreductase [Corynebacterium sp. CNJ-954]|uniref:FAD-dependent oxidoreductase n=1 Tax=Corynebacterium sp. CNJ-954 TaxID=1904962 RepID=UPI0009656F53|nr:FAD-dependent oxidoreductase [Corynebacterium sp. CNJ-954]OLT55290.1 pyridine nucleotide-disulfide oxidoreductase [Corynebacterium sp. CNJ-954]